MARLTQHWHRVEVTGHGKFPVDMLRHDQCFPIFESDSEIIRNSTGLMVHVVALGSWHPSTWTPNSDRWNSFGWNVTFHEVMK